MPDAIQQAQLADAARLMGMVGEKSNEPADNLSVDDEDADQYLPVRKLRVQFLDYLTSKADEIDEQRLARRYYHGVQFSEDELRILRHRRQPPLTWNRMSRKINGIVGLVERMRSDPKAEPTAPGSEQSADIATHVVRTVQEDNEWKSIEPWCILQAGIDGIAGTKMSLKRGDQGDPNVKLEWVIGDEFFYDPKSYRLDFTDARYMGESKWMELDEAFDLFPDKKMELKGLIMGDSDLTTSADREYKWVISAERRVRIVEHWYKHKGKWCWAFYCSNTLLYEGVSPFFDEGNNTIPAYDMFSACVDHEGDRYGFFRNLKGPQDSLNQSKSKGLHIANSRRLIMDKGAVDDVQTARIEWARPDGVIEKNPGLNIVPDERTQDLAAFEAFAQDASRELDSFGNIDLAQMAGAPLGQVTGRAVEMLRQPGLAELCPFVMAVRGWKLKVYRKIWNTAKRYWTAQRWIRVTNDQGIKQFVILNGLGLDQLGRPAMVNLLGQIGVNITMDEGPDVASLMEDAWNVVSRAPPGTFPPAVLFALMPIPQSEKAKIMAAMQPKAPDPIAQIAQKLALEEKALKNAKTAAEARKTDAGVQQVLADAAAKQAKVGETAARAGHLAHEADLDAANFVWDAYREAHEIMQGYQQANQSSQPANNNEAP